MKQVKQVPIESVHPDPRNARKHGKKDIESKAEALAEFGQQKPLIIDKDRIIRAGNGIYAAAKSLGWETIAVIETELTGEKLKAFAIADNRLGELSEWDDEILAELLSEINDSDEVEMDVTGFDLDDLDEMLDLDPGSTGGEPDEQKPKPKEKRIKTCPECGHQW